MARHRNRGPGLWTLIIVGIAIAWFAGRSSTAPVTPPAPPVVKEHGAPVIAIPQPTAPTVKAPSAPGQIAYVTASTLNVRDAPTTTGAKLGALVRGDQVSVAEVRDGWAAIRLGSGGVAWVSADYLSKSPPPTDVTREEPVRAAALGPSRSEVVRRLMDESIRRYSGNCPCPENRDRAGRRCGGRSAWSRAGGARPLCYPSDVTAAMIDRYLAHSQ